MACERRYNRGVDFEYTFTIHKGGQEATMFRRTISKRVLYSALVCVLCAAFAQGAEQPIIIDHTCTDISQIPESWIDEARDTLLIGYSHTSHGSQLVSGIEALERSNSDFAFDGSGWGHESGVFLNDQWANEYAADLGHNGYLGWRDATVTMLDNPANDRNVVMWSWCGGVSDNSPAGIQTYLDVMNDLEQQYPQVVFVYMTGHLDGGGANGNLHQRNEQIRSYCRANNKVLFDFADIESYDPDGNVDFMALYGTDGCEYDSDGDGNPWGDGNWASEWLTENPGSDLAAEASQCWDCAHSEDLNCVLKGRAFWWMMARIAGWDGGIPAPVYSYLVPAVAHAAGAAGSSWRTNLVGGNLSSSPADLMMTYDDGTAKARVVRTWTLSSGETWLWGDIVSTLFGSSGTGVVTIDSTVPVALTARTYNLAGQDRTFGQGLPALTRADAIPLGSSACVLGLVENDGFRSNLGVANIGVETASVVIRVHGADGTEVGEPVDVTVPGRGWVQVDRILIAAGAGRMDLAYATLDVTTDDALIWAYGSVVDNSTGDPTTIPVVSQ